MREEIDRPADDETTACPPVVEGSFVPAAVDPAESAAYVRGAAVGRYVLLDRIGAGGMGHVFAAYDPELDRKVAVKLVASGGFAGELRLLREAQALARLAHPNVVAIHDVGAQGAHVWIAMEFVAGETLDAWARIPRHWRAHLDVLLGVARGVAAAHAAGLVHRDLKPGNVMVSPDGRVRVMDFGLVHDRDDDHGMLHVDERPAGSAAPREALAEVSLTRKGELLGTPAYMAPEQWRGEPPAAPADQYGWSVMAWELLLGERPFVGDSRDELREAVLAGRRRPPPRGRRVPQWLRRVVERGLAGEARQRFPDMAALVSALEHGQSRVRRRVTLGVLLAVGLAVGLGLGLRRWRVVQQIAACEAAGDELDAVWSDDGEQRLRGAFTATGLSYAESTTDVILPRLGEFSAAWRAARTELCMRVDVHGRWSDDLRARAMSCLADRRLRFAATVTELERATATTVRKAVATVAGLRSVEDCLAEDMLRRQPYPAPGGEELREVQLLVAQADSLALAGDARGGLAVATRARERAERFAWPPLLADAQATEGDLLRQTSALAEAEATTVAAYFTASDAGAWDVAAKAATQLIRIVGSLDRHAEGRLWARLAAAALVHAGDPQGLREAKRLFHLGYLQTRAGAFADAKQLYLRTLALREAALAPDHPDILVTLSSLADAEEKTGSPAAARALYERVLVIQERVLGPDHLEVAAQLTNLGSLLYAAGEFAEAAPLFARSLAITEKNHGPDDPATATALNNVAAVYHVAGDTAAARPLFARALALKERVYGPDHAEVATALDNLAEIDFVLGDRGAARAGYQRALEILERRLGREHPRVAITLSHLANWHMLAEEYAAARSLFQRALTVQEQAYGPDHPEVATYLTHLSGAELADGRTSAALPLLERAIVIFDAHDGAQLAELEARYYLATALVRSGGDHARALALARRTRDDLRSAGVGREALLAEVEQWLAQRESPARPPGRGE